MLVQALDGLRGQFHRHKGGRGYREVAEEIGVSYPPLMAFAKGIRIPSYAVLEAIERWCDAQEESKRHARHDG